MSDNADILHELKRLRSESWFKDILLAVVPLLVAGLSIYYSNQNSRQQLEFAQQQMLQNRQIENAKLLEGFSQRILNGGREADLARVALDSITLTTSQKTQLAGFFESEAGGSDQRRSFPPMVVANVDAVQSAGSDDDFSVFELVEGSDDGGIATGDEAALVAVAPEVDIEQLFTDVLPLIFSESRVTRINGYTQVQSILSEENSVELVQLMLEKIRLEPFNIKGRSNVLSILADLPDEKLVSAKDDLLEFLSTLESLGKADPTYAVGPQTQGWIRRIREKLNS